MSLKDTLAGFRLNILRKPANPYGFSIQRSRVQDRVLSWFYEGTRSFFQGETGDRQDYFPSGIQLVGRPDPVTMEWELHQSPSSLLINDLRQVTKRLLPVVIRNYWRKVRNISAVYFSLDDVFLEEYPGPLPAGLAEKVLLVREFQGRFRLAGQKVARASGRGIIHFGEAVRWLVLKSLIGLRKLPNLISTFPAPVHLLKVRSSSILRTILSHLKSGKIILLLTLKIRN